MNRDAVGGATPPDAPTRRVPRVLHLSSNGSLIGGAENALFDLVAGKGSRDWEPIVVVPSEGELAAALREADVECHVVELGTLRHRGEFRSPKLAVRLAASMVAGRRLAKMIQGRGIDVVHSNTSALIAGGIATRFARAPHVWHVREMLDGPAWRILRRMILARSDRVVCISGTVAGNMQSHDPRIRVVPDGIDTDVFASRTSPVDPNLVTMVARIHPHKGHELFIRAAAQAAADVPNARFQIIGGCLPVYEPLRRKLVDLAESLGLGAALSFVQQIPRPEVAERIASSAVVVVPSTWVEPGGLVVLEAMAAGRAVIATRRGGPAEVIADERDGMLVSHQDPRELAAAMRRLLTDPTFREQLAGEGARKVREQYSLELHIRRMGALFRELAPTPSRR